MLHGIEGWEAVWPPSACSVVDIFVKQIFLDFLNQGKTWGSGNKITIG
jgi:hypothetical protein